MADPAKVEDQNILPVQALFNLDNSFNTFIGQGQPFVVSATESIGIQDVTALNATLYPTLSPVSTGQVTSLDVTSTKLTFNPYTGVLSAPEFDGVLNGNAAHATNLSNGSAGQIPYQTSSGNTSFISNGTTGQVLTSNGSSAPTWTSPTFFAAVTDDTTTNATRYPLFAAQTSGSLTTEYTSSTKYQFNPSTGVLTATQFSGSGAGLTGTASSLSIGGNAVTSTTATNIVGGANGSIPYQTGSGATTMLAAGTNGQILTLSGGVPSWVSASTSTIAISDDTTTNATRYITFTSATTGSISGENVSSTKLQYNPSTGTLTSSALNTSGGLLSNVTLSGATVDNSSPYLNFGLTSAPTYTEGRLWYDSTSHALAYYNDSSNAIVHIGQDLLLKVINNTGSTIANGSPVYITGTSSGQTYPNIALAKADVAATSAVIGLTNGAIANGAIGYVTAQGGIDGVNTGTFTAGQVLYLSPYSAGQLMNTIPPTGITVQVGVVSYVNSSTGKIYVKQTTPLNVPASIISGTLAIANGGTNGTATPTAGGISYGSGTAYAFTAAGTSGQVLISTGAGAPGFSSNIDGVTIGGTTPAAGTFTTLISNSTAQFGKGSANYQQAVGAATGLAPVHSVAGSDTNISLAFQSKGTGAIDLAAGSSGVNISNGGTVTAITSTSGGSNYTSAPTATISAPTTAGGVQATASPRMQTVTATIVSGGSGYVVGDTIVLVGGTYTGNPTTFTVATVSGGVVTGLNAPTSGYFGNYTVVPVNTISTTSSGVGTGCTLNITTWNIGGWSITNAGSGYVEQPTVSFSGGGGSGAAAYATVGSYTTVKSIGAGSTTISSASMVFNTPNGTVLTLRDAGNADTGVLVSPSSGYVQFSALGATNATLMLASAGTNSIYFNTQGTSQTNQMRVSHTASAVNYVQVTGAATGGRPTISAQGSDSAVGLNIFGKAGGSMIFSCNGTVTALQLNNTSSGVNYLQMAGAVAGSGPVLSTAGSDTNIDLALTPKGTGSVKTTANAYVGSNLYIAP